MKNLQTKTVRELVDLARKWGLSGYSKLKKAELVKKLSKKFGKKPAAKKPARKPARKPAKKPASTRKKTKAATTRKAVSRTRPKAPKETAPPAERPALPSSYRDGRMVLVARDPYWLYAYWDLTEEQERRLWKGPGATLRVAEVTSSGTREIAKVPLTVDARSWYLQVDTANRIYQAELGVADRKGEFAPIIVSNPSFTPSDTYSDSQENAFGTFSPGKVPVPAQAPLPAAGTAGVTERMYDLSTGAGMDSAQAHAGWGQPSSFDLQEESGNSDKGD